MSKSPAIELLEGIQGSETILSIPRSHYGKQLANFDWTGHSATAVDVAQFLKDARARKAPHLLLTGPPGTGKTHIAVGLYRWAALEAGTLHSTFLRATKFFSEVKETYSDRDAHNPMEDVTAADFFVALDDPFTLGGASGLRRGELDILIQTINLIHNNGAALVWTMNDDLEQLANYLGGHEIDRILENATVCEFTGESRRTPRC